MENKENVILGGDRWLMNNNVISEYTHNNIILNLYMITPAQYVEYYLDSNTKSIEVILHINTLRLLFMRKNKLMDTVIACLKDYMPDYHITVTLRRYKK